MANIKKRDGKIKNIEIDDNKRDGKYEKRDGKIKNIEIGDNKRDGKYSFSNISKAKAKPTIRTCCQIQLNALFRIQNNSFD